MNSYLLQPSPASTPSDQQTQTNRKHYLFQTPSHPLPGKKLHLCRDYSECSLVSE